ncbi:flagellin [Rheinheimera metallidurans]|uniref:flagellin N-terminal helical domain-containing protein n=1 Tax=Rheinheimera metallidurans TaxID=2925781 RepID=UPI00300296BD
MSSLSAQRSLALTEPALNISFQRLASGFRINSAADDAAGLQISNRLTSQINGLAQGIRNANDGISLAQVAEGSLDEISNMTQRMRTLVIQSRSGINSKEDKTAIQNEIYQLNKEITRVASTTSFAGIPLLDGTLNRDFLIGANAGQTVNINLDSELGFTADGLRLSEIVVDGTDGAKEKVQAGTLIGIGDPIVLPDPPVLGVVTGLQVSVNGGEFVTIPPFNMGSNPQQNNVLFATEILKTNLSFQALVNPLTNQFHLLNGSIQFRLEGLADNQLDATNNLDQISTLTGLSPQQLGSQAYTLFPPEDEQSMTRFNLDIIDEAISTVDSARAKLGATQNRLQSIIRNQANIEENLSAARSRIRDTDYAKETAELTRTQILQQTSSTVLAQANQRPQAALQLLQ